MQLEMVVGKIEELEKTLQFLSNLPKKFPTCRSFQLRLPTKRQPFKHEFMFFPENYFLLENSAYYEKPTKRLQSSSDYFIIGRIFAILRSFWTYENRKFSKLEKKPWQVGCKKDSKFQSKLNKHLNRFSNPILSFY